MKQSLSTDFSIDEKKILRQYGCNGQVEIQVYNEIDTKRLQEAIHIERMVRVGETYLMLDADTHYWLVANFYKGKYHICSECDDLEQTLAGL